MSNLLHSTQFLINALHLSGLLSDPDKEVYSHYDDDVRVAFFAELLWRSNEVVVDIGDVADRQVAMRTGKLLAELVPTHQLPCVLGGMRKHHLTCLRWADKVSLRYLPKAEVIILEFF